MFNTVDERNYSPRFSCTKSRGEEGRKEERKKKKKKKQLFVIAKNDVHVAIEIKESMLLSYYHLSTLFEILLVSDFCHISARNLEK